MIVVKREGGRKEEADKEPKGQEGRDGRREGRWGGRKEGGRTGGRKREVKEREKGSLSK